MHGVDLNLIWTYPSEFLLGFVFYEHRARPCSRSVMDYPAMADFHADRRPRMRRWPASGRMRSAEPYRFIWYFNRDMVDFYAGKACATSVDLPRGPGIETLSHKASASFWSGSSTLADAILKGGKIGRIHAALAQRLITQARIAVYRRHFWQMERSNTGLQPWTLASDRSETGSVVIRGRTSARPSLLR